MERKGTWIIASAVFLGFVFCGLSYVFAQRGDPDPPMPGGQVGRYQVVRSNNDVTIIIDTTTGDLYNAVPSDIKRFNARPRSEARAGGRNDDRLDDRVLPERPKDDVDRRLKDARRPMKD